MILPLYMMFKPFVHFPMKLSAFPESFRVMTMSPLSGTNVSDIFLHSQVYPLIAFLVSVKEKLPIISNPLCPLLSPQSFCVAYVQQSCPPDSIHKLFSTCSSKIFYQFVLLALLFLTFTIGLQSVCYLFSAWISS